MSNRQELNIIFQAFIKASEAKDVLSAFENIKREVGDIESGKNKENESGINFWNGNSKYQSLKEKLLPVIPFSMKSIFSQLDQQINLNEPLVAEMQGKEPSRVVISGSGPCGLRAAVEAAILGHEVTIFELRGQCSRHNILKTSAPLMV